MVSLTQDQNFWIFLCFGQGDIDVVGHPLLQSLAAKYQKTASQIVLRWIVQRGLITIPRAKPNHFAENLEIMTFSLSDDDMQAISGLNQNLRSNVLNDPETFPWDYVYQVNQQILY